MAVEACEARGLPIARNLPAMRKALLNSTALDPRPRLIDMDRTLAVRGGLPVLIDCSRDPSLADARLIVQCLAGPIGFTIKLIRQRLFLLTCVDENTSDCDWWRC